MSLRRKERNFWKKNHLNSLKLATPLSLISEIQFCLTSQVLSHSRPVSKHSNISSNLSHHLVTHHSSSTYQTYGSESYTSRRTKISAVSAVCWPWLTINCYCATYDFNVRQRGACADAETTWLSDVTQLRRRCWWRQLAAVSWSTDTL